MPHELGSSSPALPRHARMLPNLATLDLNLLRVFDALYEERSVTRAGSRLGVTQSAVSHALARLRELLDDDLFIRSPDGMTPTAKTRSIGPRLRLALAGLHAALAQSTFDPATADTRFTIAADPYARVVLLPGVIAQLRAAAPKVELRIQPGVAGDADALDSNRLDCVIASYRRVPERFTVQELLSERHVWVIRADHPAAAGPLTLECLASLPHLVRVITDDDAEDGLPSAGRGLERRVVQDDDGALTRAMASLGRHPPVCLTIPDSFAAMAAVAQSDLAALIPARMARTYAATFALALFDPPYPSAPVPISMVWHRTHGNNPASDWLRTLITNVAAQL